MALSATISHIEISLSDVDRSVYETLDLHVAQHPSETTRYMLTRTLAYALAYEDGIAFSKGGLSSADAPPLSVHDRTGRLLAWIDVGTPAADRLHRATKLAERVAIYSSAELATLRREAEKRAIHRVEAIDVFRFDVKFLDALEARLARRTRWEITRSDGDVYVTVDKETLSTSVARESLVAPS